MNIVLALDGSAESIEAASFLARLPFKDKPSVTVVTALVDTPFELVHADAGLQLREAEKSAARIAFQTIESTLRSRCLTLEHVLERAHPNHLIIETAAKCDADLIVLGAKGHNALYRAVLGSTADYVANHAKTSVVIVRPDTDGKFASASEPFRVLMAHDGSKAAKIAFDQMWSLDWPADRSEFAVARLLERPKLIPDDVVFDPDEIRQSEATLQELIAPWKEEYAVKSIVRETLDVGSCMTKLVITDKRNLLFVGGSAKSVLQRFFLGSASRHALHHVDCPIWFARQKHHA